MSIQAAFKLEFDGFCLDINIDIPSKGVTALFGSSGSGKSSLLRCIAGLEQAQGSLIVDGEVWQDAKTFLPPHQRPIAYVFQEANLFPHMTVKANLEYGFKRQKQAANNFDLDSVIELLGIAHLLDRKPAKLSGGEKQRVAIARALAVNPKVLLMDEPMAALDNARKREIMPFLENLHDSLSIPIIYVTHSPQEVMRLADHMVVLEQGKVIRSGKLNETLSHLDNSLQQGNKASVIIEAVISEIQTEWHLAKASFNGGDIWLRDQAFQLDQKVRFRIMASDVSVATKPNHDSSIANVIAATIDVIEQGDHPAISYVRLKVGETFILGRLTSRSVDSLGIKQGDQVWAQIKLAAIVE